MAQKESEPNLNNPSPTGKSFANTVNFLEDASVVPIDWKMQFPVKAKVQSQENWERMWEVVGLYAGSEDSLDDIADKYNLTRERVRQIFKAGIAKLHEQTIWHIANRHPLETLGLAKPLTIRSRQNISRAGGGTSSKIAELVKEGVGLKEIQSSLAINSSQLNKSRSVLSHWKVEIPYKREGSSPTYKKMLERLRNPKTSPAKIWQILNTIDESRYQRYSRGANPYLIPVSKIARQCGFVFKSNRLIQITDCLNQAGIPVGIAEKKQKGQKSHHYRFIAVRDRESVIKILQTDSSLAPLRKSRIVQISGQELQIPNNYNLLIKGEYKSIGSILKELGYNWRAKSGYQKLVEKDCPAPVYIYTKRTKSGKDKRAYYFHKKDHEAIKSYLQKKLVIEPK